MNINLINNNSTFGATFTSPPEHFTTGCTINPESTPTQKFISSFPVSKKKAYFVHVVNNPDLHSVNDQSRRALGHEYMFRRVNVPDTRTIRTRRTRRTRRAVLRRENDLGRSIIREGWNFGRVVSNSSPALASLSPHIRFIPAEFFDNCERIPLKELSDRRIAILDRETVHTDLGSIGADNRRRSFYQNKTAIHPHFQDELRVDELVRLGFFVKPADLEPTQIELPPDSVTNVSFTWNKPCDRYFFNWEEKDIVEQKFRQLSHTRPELWDYSNTCKLLAAAVIDIDKVPQPATIATVFSPLNGLPLMLIRHPDTELPMLQGPRALKAKHAAFVEYATAHPQSALHKAVSKPIRDAKFFKSPFDKEIQLCNKAIRPLMMLLYVYQAIGHPTSPIIQTTIDKLEFARYYMNGISDFIKEAMIYDDWLMLKNTTAVRSDIMKQRDNNKEQLIAKEIEFITRAKSLNFLEGDLSVVPMFYLNHLIMTSLYELLVNTKEDYLMKGNFKGMYTDLKKQSEDIIIQTDEMLLSQEETIKSLKLMTFSASGQLLAND